MEAVLNGPNGRFVLGPAPFTIGRTPDNQLAVNDIKASSHHAEIRPGGQGYTLIDLGSTNGTFVNGQQLEHGMPRQLNSGDTIRIGDTPYTYQTSGMSDSQYAATAHANPGQGAVQGNGSSGYEPTIAASSSSSPSPSTAYGANAMQGYSSSSPDYPPYNQGAQPSYAGGQSYPPPPNPAYNQPSYTPPPPAYPAYNQPDAMVYLPPLPTNQVNQSVGGMPMYGGMPPQAPPKKGRSTGMIVLVVVIVLVLIVGSLGFLLVHNNQVATDNTNATATAHTITGNHLTATAHVLASQTAVANVHATATATIVAGNPNPYPPRIGTLALYDPLTDNTQGYQWDDGNGCAFNGGSYHVSEATVGKFTYCVAGAHTFSNFAYRVEMTITKGDCGGMVFHTDVNNSNFYNFEVCQDGSYYLAVYANGNGKYLIQPNSNVSIKKGLNQDNIIAVVAQGGLMTLYANNQNLGTATDSSFTSGTVGLVGDASNSSTDVAYGFAEVWTL